MGSNIWTIESQPWFSKCTNHLTVYVRVPSKKNKIGRTIFGWPVIQSRIAWGRIRRSYTVWSPVAVGPRENWNPWMTLRATVAERTCLKPIWEDRSIPAGTEAGGAILYMRPYG